MRGNIYKKGRATKVLYYYFFSLHVSFSRLLSDDANPIIMSRYPAAVYIHQWPDVETREISQSTSGTLFSRKCFNVVAYIAIVHLKRKK